MTHNSFIDHCWFNYIDLAPQAKTIWDDLKELKETIRVDHIALRTFNLPGISMDEISKCLIHLGYHIKGGYEFKEKGLIAHHFDAGEDYPLIFVSQFDIGFLSQSNQEIILENLKPSQWEELSLSRLAHHRPWAPPNKEDLDNIWEESEYAGWVFCHGLRVNHFTIDVNSLIQFEHLENLNDWLIEKQYPMNTSGALVKGTEKIGLKQSSTMSPKINVHLADGTYEIPGCYVEFSERFNVDGHLFRAFLGKSANDIFESTNK